ncbi:MAG TPA: caspase family protein [Pyrinomonadaceae bacterium]|nr:caspase family protein [Pyrinomonadaceae bacterium]
MKRAHSRTSAFVALALAYALLPLSFPARAAGQDARPAAPQKGVKLGRAGDISELPSGAKRWALVIGVDDYKDGQIGSLRGAANDARALADALRRYAGFPADQIVLMTTDQPEERQPTRVNILRRLSNLASVVPKDGLLLVSFSGHGIERGGHAYLLPSDAQITDDVTFLEETAVSVSRMHERIRATGVGQVLVLLDACRNDPGGRADAPNPLTEAYTRGFNFDVRNREVQAFATLYATAVGYRAYEYGEKKQGYFSWALVEGLKGAASNERGEVTLARLVEYVQTVVPKRVGIDLGSGRLQRPFAVIEGYKADDLIVSVVGPGAADVAAAPHVSPSSPAVEDAPRPPATAAGLNLAGTQWVARASTGFVYVYEFREGGKLFFKDFYEVAPDGWRSPHLPADYSTGFSPDGSWELKGNSLTMQTGGKYVEYEGVVGDGRIEGRAYSKGQVEWTWLAIKRDPATSAKTLGGTRWELAEVTPGSGKPIKVVYEFLPNGKLAVTPSERRSGLSTAAWLQSNNYVLIDGLPDGLRREATFDGERMEGKVLGAPSNPTWTAMKKPSRK